MAINVNSFGINSLFWLVIVFILTACTPPSLVAVEERKTIDPRVETERIGGSRIRIAQPGDTLHSIAFANGLNVNKLAAWNRLADTSRLNIGQRIRLTRPLNFVAAAAKSAGSATQNPASEGSAKPLDSKSIGTKPLIANSNANSTVALQNQAPNAGVSVSPREASSGLAIKQDGQTLAKGPVTWKWPTKGKLIGYFSAKSGKQGIDIQGQIGQEILAASAGQVVYVGNGLKGYGNLIIIKHNEQFLSAYAHNQQLFVREGQDIGASQRIASLGKDNKQRNALHFQIRKDGQPVNPLSYLPRL